MYSVQWMLGHKLTCIHTLRQCCNNLAQFAKVRCAKSSDYVASRLQAVTTRVIGDKRVMWKETRIDECECQVQCDAAPNESSALARPPRTWIPALGGRKALCAAARIRAGYDVVKSGGIFVQQRVEKSERALASFDPLLVEQGHDTAEDGRGTGSTCDA